MDTSPPRLVPERMDTGVPGLDRILSGGLVRSGLYLLEGTAGSGKTLLAAQVASHRARLGERVLYVTLLAEFHGKLLEHLRTLEFFDEDVFSRSVLLVSGYDPLVTGGTQALLGFIAEALRDQHPALLIVEGFATLRDRAGSHATLAEFVHQLNTLVTTSQCTTLLVGMSWNDTSRAELALVDGIVELTTFDSGMRRGRALQVLKTRASPHLAGRHTFAITRAGLRVYPRLEALLTENAPAMPASTLRVPIGVDALDDMIGGGLVEGTSTRLLGAPGIGKTLLGLQFLVTGARTNEKGLYFGFYEGPERLKLKAAAIGMNLAGPVTDGRVTIRWQPQLELSEDELADDLLTTVREMGIRRVLIDGLEAFRDSALHPERYSLIATALTVALRGENVTTIFTEELEPFGESLGQMSFGVSALIENLLLLNYVEIDGELRRLVSVMKLRDSDFDPAIREFMITNRGLRVGRRFSGVEHTITGKASVQRRAARSPSRTRGARGRKSR